MAKIYPYYLANKAVFANENLEVTDKFSGEVVYKVAMADENAIDQAISKAVEAEKAMAALPGSARKSSTIACNALKTELKNWPRPSVLRPANRLTTAAAKLPV